MDKGKRSKYNAKYCLKIKVCVTYDYPLLQNIYCYTVDDNTQNLLFTFTPWGVGCVERCVYEYLRLNIPEVFNPSITSSTHRHITLDHIPKPATKQDIINILGDSSDKEFPIFRSKEYVRTIVVGIFDFVARTWNIYTGNPKENSAVAILPIQLKGFDK